MKPHIRNALLSTSAVLSLIGLTIWRMIYWGLRISGHNSAAVAGWLVEAGIFAGILVLGLSIAWWRIFRDRAERRRRPAPLNLG